MSQNVQFYIWITVSFLLVTGSEPIEPHPGLTTHSAQAAKGESKSVERKPLMSEIQRNARLQHARELLGKYYKHSVVRHGEKIKKVNHLIYRFAREHLPAKYRAKYKAVAQTIIDESARNEFDPVLLVSVILGESSFNPDCKGPFDEIGLMQLRPATGEWIAKKYGLHWAGPKTLRNPVENIRIGAAYLHFLREKFDSHAQLYLAAYNMGAGSVDKSREKNIWPKDYPVHVMRRYLEFYSSLED
ncbi:MAG: lytic transglycosylase domain-containing protein [Bdellovibrio sp.]|nr:MAG: lytic transglycosylase domain-containing protein [Bdellovibrio sp.]